MNSKRPLTLFACWLALALLLLPALRAASFAEPAETKPETPPPAPAVVAVVPDKPVETDKAPAPAAEEAKPAGDKSEVTAPADDQTVKTDSTPSPEPEPAAPVVKGKKGRALRPVGSHHANNERVSFAQNSTLAAGEKADAVVSIFGSSSSSGEVAGAVVSVIGNTRVNGGTVGDAAVAVLGNTYVNGHIKGQVVAVLGNIELGPDAVVDGEIVCVGGEVKRDAQAAVHGNVQNIALGGRHFNFDWLTAWFTQCVLYARPLAFGENLAWAWCVAFVFLGFYALIALVAPAGVEKCVSTLEERPGYSLLSAVLTLLLTPVAFLLLALTLFLGIGFALIPLFTLGLFIAGLFGKIVILAWLGSRLTKLLGDGPLTKPVFSVLIGGLIVMLLYTVPILGIVLYKLLGVLGLGVVVYTLLLLLKGNRAAAASKQAAAAAARQAAMPPPLVLGEAAPAAVPNLPPVVSAVTLPRAGFWRRLAACFLDFILVAMATGLLHSVIYWINPGGIPFWLAVYSVAMWAIKGTTIGGIVCGLKVVRLDDRPLDWSVAAVRGLSAFLSLAVAGLGFIWVAFDDEKQSWHDKIAGTTIVKVPKGTALL